MRDFTLGSFGGLIERLLGEGYNFIPFREFKGVDYERVVILRHDVDLLPENSLKTAEIENQLGIKGSYYFRIVPESFDTNIIKRIYDLGHEIGYHYEDVDLVINNYKLIINSLKDKEELIDLAYKSFCDNLERMREIVRVETVCMHGSPRARYDNKMIWEKYDYRELGIKGEPYFDVDWNVFGYLTDTGRRWNGDKYSIRDKVDSRYKFDFKRTEDIIRNVDMLPDRMMITVHPQRWTEGYFLWGKEMVWQNFKNGVKYFKNKLP